MKLTLGSRSWLTALMGIGLSLAAIASGCNSSGGNSGSGPTYPGAPAAPPAAPPAQPGQLPLTVQTSQTSLGEFLTDGQGRSLYVFEGDSSGLSNCNGACAAAWPPLTVPSGQNAVAAGGADATLLGTLTREDGSTQVSYKGMPLYYFIDDSAAGQSNGEGVSAFGALWYLVMPDGSALTG